MNDDNQSKSAGSNSEQFMRLTPGFATRPHDFDAATFVWFERPSTNKNDLEVWTYTDNISYEPGEAVSFCISGTCETATIEVIHDALIPQTVHKQQVENIELQPTPETAYKDGCGWNSSHTWTLPDDLASGGYIVRTRVERGDRSAVHEHMFIVRPSSRATRAGRILLVASTCTWVAYNDWGGASHYYGIDAGGRENGASAHLSIQRPWQRGLVSLPKGAPRVQPRSKPKFGDALRYEMADYALANGYSKYYGSAGWASYERPFAHWLEKHNYAFDVVSQQDLEACEDLLTGYDLVLFVGHDEYWSWPMREAVDAYSEAGGKVARFGGNFFWQVRLENNTHTQVCYKYQARELDPYASEGPLELLTSAWEDTKVNRPGATTFGVNGFRGVYSGWGGFQPGASRGFTVFRHKHWCFEGTNLGYAEVFGEESAIFGFETDGLEYTFHEGLPFPTHQDGAPEEVEILAMGFSSLAEKDNPVASERSFLQDREARAAALFLDNSQEPEDIEKRSRGSGVIVNFKKGKGEVFCAGTTEWVSGLIDQEPVTERITHNVLSRYLSQ